MSKLAPLIPGSSYNYWVFESYTFQRNPDRVGGDTGWITNAKMNTVEIIGASKTRIQLDGFTSATRKLRFTAIPGSMMRKLQYFFLRGTTITTCVDHLYVENQGYSGTSVFNCVITEFTMQIHPTSGNFPLADTDVSYGSKEDTYDVDMTILRV